MRTHFKLLATHRHLWRAQYIGSAFVAGILALLSTSAEAHDFWIQPSKFRPASGDSVSLQLLVGQELKGETALYNPAQFERYVVAGPNGTQPVAGQLGDDPAGRFAVGTPGLYVVGYYSKKFDVTFDTQAEFEKYLAMEGLERHRQASGRRRLSLRDSILEIYTRCAKTLIRTDKHSAPPFDRPLGFPLELIALSDVYSGSNEVELQLLYQGKPLADSLVVASNPQAPQEKLRLRTNADGRVKLTLTRPGMWLVTSVHMLPASLFARADWESYWASLTFERPAPPNPKRRSPSGG